MSDIIIAIPPGSFVGYPFNEPAILLSILHEFKPILVEFNLDLLNFFLEREGGTIEDKLLKTYGTDYSKVTFFFNIGRIFFINNADYLLSIALNEAFLDRTVEKITTMRPRIILFIFQFLRSNIQFLRWISAFACKLKKVIPSTIIGCAGSNLATLIDSDLEYIKKFLPEIDFLLKGNPEREITRIFQPYLEYNRFPSLKGLFLFHKEKYSVSTDIMAYPNCEFLIPNWEQYRFNEYLNFRVGTRICSVLSSRGCIYHCAFCDEYIRMGPYQIRKLEDVKKEIGILKDQYNVNIIRFTDSALNFDVERMKNLSKILKPLNIYWMGMMRADIPLLKEDFDDFYNSGCRSLWFGLESASTQSQKRLQKFVKPKITSKIIANASQAGIKIILLLISDIPFEKPSDIRKTMDFCRKNKHNIDAIHLEKFRLMQTTTIYNNYSPYCITSFIKQPLKDELNYLSPTPNYDQALRNFCFKIKGVGDIKLPKIETYTIITEI